MSVTQNTFVVGVRRHFGKYSPYQKSRMMFKFSLALTLFSLILTTTGVFIDEFHGEDSETFKLRNGDMFDSAGSSVGHINLTLEFPNCDTPETVQRESSKLFGPKGVSFGDLTNGPTGSDEVFDLFVNPSDDTISALYFGQFDTYYKMGRIALGLSYSALGLLLLSVIISIASQTPPNSFLSSEPTFGQSKRDYMWGSLHHGLTIFAAVLLLLDLAIVSTYLDLVLGRVIELSFELCNYTPGGNELDVLRIYGDFLEKYSRVNGTTGMTYKVSIGLILLQAGFVFLVGIEHEKGKYIEGGPSVPQATYIGGGENQIQSSTSLSIPNSMLRQLPWYCSIWKIQFSVLFFMMSYIADVATSVYTRTHGYPLNLYAFRTISSSVTGNGATKTGALSDMIMDFTSTYYISDTIPGALTNAWLCFACLLGFGSTDVTKYFSKFIQLAGCLLALRSVLAISSIVPVPSTVITSPYCYDEPTSVQFELKVLWESLYDLSWGCNHSMFSFQAAFTTLSIGIMMMYVRYGPMVFKSWTAYLVLFLCAVGSALVPVVARVNYSSETNAGFFIALLLVFTQSAAFKLLFKFSAVFPLSAARAAKISILKINPSVLINEKLIPIMNECMKRVKMYQIGTKETPGLCIPANEFDEILLLYQSVGHAMRMAKDAKPMQPLSSVGIAITEIPLDRNATPAPQVNAQSENNNDLINMIAASQYVGLPDPQQAVNTDLMNPPEQNSDPIIKEGP